MVNLRPYHCQVIKCNNNECERCMCSECDYNEVCHADTIDACQVINTNRNKGTWKVRKGDLSLTNRELVVFLGGMVVGILCIVLALKIVDIL